MQTFLPYADLRASSVVLDDRRLGKQRVETFQILRALTWPTYAWKNHPAVRMWRGFVPALVAYGLANCAEWSRRGYADSVGPQLLGWTGGHPPRDLELPPWFGLEAVHRSHRSALVRKDPAFYRPLFGQVPDDLPYAWPATVFPSWPLRLPAAESELTPGQGEMLTRLRSGDDVLLVDEPPQASASGVLAGQSTPGRTLWITALTGPLDPPPPPVEEPPWRMVMKAPSATTARPPGPADIAAMEAEAGGSDWTFRRPGEAAFGSYGLIVVEAAHSLTCWRRPVAAPVLALIDPHARPNPEAVSKALALRAGRPDAVVELPH